MWYHPNFKFRLLTTSLQTNKQLGIEQKYQGMKILTEKIIYTGSCHPRNLVTHKIILFLTSNRLEGSNSSAELWQTLKSSRALRFSSLEAQSFKLSTNTFEAFTHSKLMNHIPPVLCSIDDISTTNRSQTMDGPQYKASS